MRKSRGSRREPLPAPIVEIQMQQAKRFGRRVPIHSTRQIRHQLLSMLQEDVRQAESRQGAAATPSSQDDRLAMGSQVAVSAQLIGEATSPSSLLATAPRPH